MMLIGNRIILVEGKRTGEEGEDRRMLIPDELSIEPQGFDPLI
jgi:hypothetical protein